MQKYVFLLGREPILSLCELKSLFSSIEQRGDFAFIETDDATIEKQKKWLWWTIKIGLVIAEWLKKTDILELIVTETMKKIQPGKKLRLGVDMFIPSMSTLVFKVKDRFKKWGHSIRIVQHDIWRIKTATTIHEKLIEQGLEFIVLSDKTWFTVAKTIWIQDIESYSERDMNRDRSMTVGMMPPKIAQIMINLGTKSSKDIIIWDPFCGLGTTLIEALHAGFTQIIWSDIEPAMVEITNKNISKQPGYLEQMAKTFRLDATQINNYKNSWPAIIITEGMLGTNFTTTNITPERAIQERKKLIILYENYLSSAYANDSIKRMVFCLPFWNVGKDTIFMPEISQLSKQWQVDEICRFWKRYISHTRPGQCVGREIVVVQRG
jgi:tRNA G10  N-methylase Trm11